MKLSMSVLLGVLLFGAAARGQDPGKDEIGTVKTELIFGTDGELEALGPKAKELRGAELERLRKSKNIPKFKLFARLGSDTQPILRGYKNWAAPLAGSKAIMVTFQPQGVVGNKLRMDLELWQKKEMVMRADPTLDRGERVYILGPKWRGGRLIIRVQLVSLRDK